MGEIVIIGVKPGTEVGVADRSCTTLQWGPGRTLNYPVLFCFPEERSCGRSQFQYSGRRPPSQGGNSRCCCRWSLLSAGHSHWRPLWWKYFLKYKWIAHCDINGLGYSVTHPPCFWSDLSDGTEIRGRTAEWEREMKWFRLSVAPSNTPIKTINTKYPPRLAALIDGRDTVTASWIVRRCQPRCNCHQSHHPVQATSKKDANLEINFTDFYKLRCFPLSASIQPELQNILMAYGLLNETTESIRILIYRYSFAKMWRSL